MSGPHISRRLRFVEWTQAVLLATNLAWTTLCLGGYRAETMVVTASLTAALLGVHAFGSALSGQLHPAGLMFVPFVAYAAANVFWVTPVRWLGWIDWFGWVQMTAVFWVVLNGIRSRRPQWFLLGTLLVLAVVAVLLGCYQRFVQADWLMLGRIQADQYAGRASGPFGIPNSFAAFLLLLIPLCGVLALRRGVAAWQRVLFAWLTLVLLLGLGLTISRGAWLGFAVALTAWPLLASRVSLRKRLLFGVAVLVTIGLAGAAAGVASSKVRERFGELVRDVGERSRPILWRAGWKIFRAHPAFGSGGGSFNVLFERYRPDGFLNEPHWAHNDFLNTLSDYGAVGFGLFFGAISVTLVCCARSRRRNEKRGIDRSLDGEPRSARSRRRAQALDDPLIHQALAIGLLAFALQLFVDFHFKIPALAMMCATLAAILVQRTWAISEPASRPWLPLRGALPSVALLGTAAVIAGAVVPLYRGEAWRQRGRVAIESLADEPAESPRFAQQLTQARDDLARAVALAPSNGQAWADRSYAAAQWSRRDTAGTAALGREAEAYANRALDLGAVFPEFWLRRGVARDMQGRWLEAGDDFVQAIVLSPKSPLVWFHQGYHLSLRKNEYALATAAADICLRLDPRNPDGQRLRQRLATGRSGR